MEPHEQTPEDAPLAPTEVYAPIEEHEPAEEHIPSQSPPTAWWKRPAVIVGAAALVVLAGVGIYVQSVIGQWEAYAADIEAQLEAANAQTDRFRDQVNDARADAAEAEQVLARAETELARRENELAEAEAAVAEREAAVNSAEERVAATSIQEGTWVVGRDIEPGTYRTANVVGSTCYWGIYRSGTNGDDIIENDIPGGGYPTVTLREGQDFQTRRCGTWIQE